MATNVGIVNLALSHLAISKEIANLETERSEEASTARRYFDVARDFVLSAVHWPFATRIAALALVESDPNTEWGYSYRYPTDCMKVRRILSGMRNDTRQSRIPYRLSSDTQGKLIFTDQESAEIEYTVRIDNPEYYTPEFELALSYYLAGLMAARLTGGDQFKLGDKAMQFYRVMISVAAANSFNEEQAEEVPDSQFIRERE